MYQELIQQGDVLIYRVDGGIPAGAKRVEPKARGYVLAEGEATGHAHVIAQAPEIELFEADGLLWLRTGKETSVTHEEHGTVTIPPGTFQIGIVREVDPFEGEIRNVMD